MVIKLQTGVLQAIVNRQSMVDVDVLVLESVDSTNTWCMQQNNAGKNLPFACFAEEQTLGKGRRGKAWHMPSYSNIAMTLMWPFAVSYQQIHLLPLSIALAVVETLESFGLQQVQVKWPNDVFVGHKKIAGILIETQPVKNAVKEDAMITAAIGIGLNYDMSTLDTKIRQSLALTDICSEVKSLSRGKKPERIDVASGLLKNVINVCRDYQHSSMCYLERFRAQYDYCKEKNVEIMLDNKDVLSGLAQGVNDEAEFLVLIDGQQRAFNSAEVSVKV